MVSQWFYETVILLRELLIEDGSIYVHCDWHIAHYAKVILDDVFGKERFRNEIVWKRKTGRGQTNYVSTEFGTQTDTIFFYTKSEKNYFQNPIKPLREEYIEQSYRFYEPDGRRYRIDNLASTLRRKHLHD